MPPPDLPRQQNRQVSEVCGIVQAMRQVADVIHATTRRAAIFDRRRKQEEALRLQGLWLRWELSTFEYLMRVSSSGFCSSGSSLFVNMALHAADSSPGPISYWLMIGSQARCHVLD